MRPLLWTDRRAAAVAAGLLGWLISIELGTSRAASRSADDDADERVIDTSTSRLFDAAAGVAMVGAVASSLAATRATVRARRSCFGAGLIVLAGSGFLSVVARRHLGRFHRDSLTVHGDHELVDSGPYEHIRHPLYTATIGVFVGGGAVLGNWISLALAALPTAALVHRIHVEEDMLLGALGTSYSDYCSRTARLVPGCW